MRYRMSEGMANIGTPLKEAMERTPRPKEPEQEPVANVVLRDGLPTLLANNQIKPTDERLYTTPPQRPWVGLTDEEENEYNYLGPDMHWVIQEIEAKLKDKNT